MDATLFPALPGITSQVALVTGASRGIGRTIARALARQGAIVVGTATSQSGAESITADLEAYGQGRGIALDVRDSVAVDEAVRDIVATEGAPTLLINNAGITRDNILMRMKDDEWADVIETNLSSVFRVSKACLRGMMKARSGRIINISSVVGLMGNTGQANYAAAKAGMQGFTRSMAREVASRNITVNTIAPGFIESDMTRALDPVQVDALRANIPSGKLGSADDIAAAVVFLCSEAGSYITGETLNVNGGLFMH